jgi:putative ABC transport system ATP-binding protein
MKYSEMRVNMKECILRTKNLCKSFANNGVQNHVLDNVNLELYQGEFTAVMGASGSGKSTLLYSLSCMDSITSGEVYYHSQRVDDMKEKQLAALRAKEFGFVFQQMHLVSNLTVMENVLVPGYLSGKMTAAEVKEHAAKLLSLVNVEGASNRLPSQVSGGEAQRAAIARAIIADPGILFADEPTGALNRRNTEDVLNLLTSINKKGQSILMVTHDIRAALRADRLLYLEDGKIKGEMSLAPFDESDFKNREKQVNAWLTSLEW